MNKKSKENGSTISFLMAGATFGAFSINEQAKNEDFYYIPEFEGLDGQDFINFGNNDQAQALENLQTELQSYSEKRLRGVWNDSSPLHLEGSYNSFLNNLAHREGIRNDVYLDSLGKPTVGVGHLVLESDNLKVGDIISDEQIQAFLEKDASHAWNTALDQAAELGVTTPKMVEALAAVNYQLGTNWTSDFKNTWAAMKDGDFESAAHHVQDSLWAQQTPTRVADFQQALTLDHTG